MTRSRGARRVGGLVGSRVFVVNGRDSVANPPRSGLAVEHRHR